LKLLENFRWKQNLELEKILVGKILELENFRVGKFRVGKFRVGKFQSRVFVPKSDPSAWTAFHVD
jgi:hypothetical protein